MYLFGGNYRKLYIWLIKTKQIEIMTTTTNNNTMTKEMNLTQREIRLIAFEAEGVNNYDTHVMDEFSDRAQKFIYKANGNPSYVIGRCYFLINGKKLVD